MLRDTGAQREQQRFSGRGVPARVHGCHAARPAGHGGAAAWTDAAYANKSLCLMSQGESLGSAGDLGGTRTWVTLCESQRTGAGGGTANGPARWQAADAIGFDRSS